MGERKVVGLFKLSPRPKWRQLTGAMRSFTVARDFQKLAMKNVGSRLKPGRTGTNSATRSGGQTSSWMTSDEDDEDDDFAELSDFEIDEDECEKSRFTDTFSSLSTDVLSYKAPKEWDEDSVPFLSFDSAIKSTQLEKQEPEDASSEIRNFEHGVLASSTPKSNKIKNLNAVNESESRFALELEEVVPMDQEAPCLKADLFDDSHVDVEIPEISMSGEKDVLFNNSNPPNIPSHLHLSTCFPSETETVELNKKISHCTQNVCSCTLQNTSKCVFSDSVMCTLDSTLEDMEYSESLIYDEKGEPSSIGTSLNTSTHLNETMVPEQFAEPSRTENPSFDNTVKSMEPIGKVYTFNKSIYSVTSGRFDESLPTADSSSFDKTLVSEDEKGKNLHIKSSPMITKLPKLGRKLAFRRKKLSDLPKTVML